MKTSTLRRGIVPAAIVLTLAASLAACGDDSGSTANATDSAISCESGNIKASGSTAQKNAITEWINAYQSSCTDATINYTANGSGAGIADFTKNQTAFAGSDSSLKPEEQTAANARCKTGDAINLPMVVGPIAVAYNLEGVDKLTLTPDVIAGIFANQITKWNDPKIAAINEGVSLPDATIAQFHRGDDSGTTSNFAKYLEANAPSIWTFGTEKKWKAPGGQGVTGSDQIAASLKSTPNSISYVEYSFTQEGGLGVAEIDNGSGAVALTPEAAGKAVGAATVTGTGNDVALKLDYTTKADGAYPIILVTYEITCEKGLASDELALTKSFLGYTSSNEGQATLTEIGYAPVPSEILTKVQASVAAIS